MTVPTTDFTVTRVASGGTTVFSYPFKILDETHLEVSTETGGTVTPQTLGVNFSVDGVGNDDGGTITFLLSVPAAAVNVIMTRVVPLEQTTSFRSAGSFNPRSHENAFDLGLMQLIQMQNLRPLTYTSATEPEASSATSGFIVVKDPGSPAVLKFAIQNTDGSWEWATVTVGV